MAILFVANISIEMINHSFLHAVLGFMSGIVLYYTRLTIDLQSCELSENYVSLALICPQNYGVLSTTLEKGGVPHGQTTAAGGGNATQGEHRNGLYAAAGRHAHRRAYQGLSSPPRSYRAIYIVA